jgi:hypothetical protein
MRITCMGPLYLKVDDIGDCYGAVLARGFTPSAAAAARTRAAALSLMR